MTNKVHDQYVEVLGRVFELKLILTQRLRNISNDNEISTLVTLMRKVVDLNEKLDSLFEVLNSKGDEK